MEQTIKSSFIRLTRHAKERSLIRFGIKESTLVELAEKSVLEGYSTGDAPSKKIRRWLQRKAKDKKIYVYSGYVFIFTSSFKLITTYRLPDYLLRSLPRAKSFGRW